jgi:serine/threonine protein kinase
MVGYFPKNNGAWVVVENVKLCASLPYLIQQQPLLEDHIRDLVRGILFGLQCLHQHAIVHGMLEPNQIFLNPAGNVYLSYFGPGEVPLEFSPATAPEVRQGTKVYTKESDIWSIGQLCLRFAFGCMDQTFTEIANQFQDQFKAPYTEDYYWTVHFRQFVAKCLNPNPIERPSVEQLLLDPFLAVPSKCEIESGLRQWMANIFRKSNPHVDLDLDATLLDAQDRRATKHSSTSEVLRSLLGPKDESSNEPLQNMMDELICEEKGLTIAYLASPEELDVVEVLTDKRTSSLISFYESEVENHKSDALRKLEPADKLLLCENAVETGMENPVALSDKAPEIELQLGKVVTRKSNANELKTNLNSQTSSIQETIYQNIHKFTSETGDKIDPLQSNGSIKLNESHPPSYAESQSRTIFQLDGRAAQMEMPIGHSNHPTRVKRPYGTPILDFSRMTIKAPKRKSSLGSTIETSSSLPRQRKSLPRQDSAPTRQHSSLPREPSSGRSPTTLPLHFKPRRNERSSSINAKNLVSPIPTIVGQLPVPCSPIREHSLKSPTGSPKYFELNQPPLASLF